MNELRRHRLAFTVLSPLVALFLKIKFRYTYDDLGKIEGPYLLLANHNLELDPALVGAAVGKQLYFVASEHILRKGFGTWFLMTFFKPIIHRKGRQGMNTIKQMLKMLKEGHSVCIFPEGNRSFNGLTGEMLPSIGKVARCSGAKLVTYRMEGGYLSQPRWSLSLRRGRIRGRLIQVYTAEEMKAMTDEQINNAICRDLFEDAYATQGKERIPFKGKNLALGLESTIFACPKCGQISTLHSDATHLYCDCGFRAVYDVYGDLTDEAGRKYTVTELDHMQRQTLKSRLLGAFEKAEDEKAKIENVGVVKACEEGAGSLSVEQPVMQPAMQKALFTDSVILNRIDNEHRLTGTETGNITACADGFEICNRKYSFEEIQGMAIYSRNAIILHVKGEEGHLEIKGDKMFNALKYLYLYEMITKEKVG